MEILSKTSKSIFEPKQQINTVIFNRGSAEPKGPTSTAKGSAAGQ